MKRKLAMVGGDIREGVAADILIKYGFKLFSYRVPEQKSLKRLRDCLQGAEVLFLPVRSNLPEGGIYLENNEKLILKAEDLTLLKPNAVIYGGAVSASLKSEIKKTGHILKEFMENDEIAVPNAVLTAEGTLYEMMSLSKKACSEWKIGILGAGRVGMACAELLRKVGAGVTVFCRKESDYMSGKNKGFDMRYYAGLASIGPYFDFLINTVPAPVVSETVISVLNRDTVIIDLASAPGGTDFTCAEQKGMKAFLLPGVPGKYAPVSAGKILGNYYLRELCREEGGVAR